MAVIVTNGNTTLATASGFYRSDAYNIGTYCNGIATGNFGLSLTTAKQNIAVTFANAANCKGVVLALTGNFGVSIQTNAAFNRDVTAKLQETKTPVTISIASPGVVTFTAHGLANGQQFEFATTGALPTGFTAGTTYFVVNQAANTFQVSLTSGGAAINTSGTQSGTHSIWIDRATKTRTRDDIIQNNYSAGVFLTPFEFTAAYAVDITASKWRINVSQGSGSGTWYVLTSDATALSYVTWSDVSVSFASTDFVVAKDKCKIDMSATFGALTGTGFATVGNCGWSCVSPNASTSADDWDMFYVDAPAAAYTLTLKGYLTLSSRSIFKIGKASSVIPYSTQFKLLADTPTYGSAGQSGLASVFRAQYYGDVGSGLAVYGEVPSRMRSTLTAGTAVGSPTLTVDNETGWANGDIVAVTKQDTGAASSATLYTVLSTSANTVTLTGNIATNDRLTGGKVARMGPSGFGVVLEQTSSSPSSRWIILGNPCRFHIQGAFIKYPYFTCCYSMAYLWPNNLTEVYTVTSCVIQGWSMNSNMFNYFNGPGGTLVEDCNFALANTGCKCFVMSRATPAQTGVIASTGGTIARRNLVTNPGMFTDAVVNSDFTYQDNIFHNTSCGFAVGGYNATITNNEFYGVYGGGAIQAGALTVGSVYTNLDVNNNSFIRCLTAVWFTQNAIVLGTVFKNSTFNSNTTDLAFKDDQLLQNVLFDGITTPAPLTYTGTLSNMVPGSFIGLASEGAAGVDRTLSTFGIFAKTGDGLVDTRVHTAGTGAYAMKMNPSTTTDELRWVQKLPIGSYKNKTAQFGIWINITSANYYAGVHVLPHIHLEYDNGTVVTAYALAQTGWQFVSVPYTPVTDYGEITITLAMQTDATGTDADIIVDDAAAAPPPGIAPLNLGALDLWAGAMPVVPSLSLPVFSAQDVWAVLPSTFGVGTVGEALEIARKLVANNYSVAGDIVSIKQDDGASTFRQYRVSATERTKQ
jgi:hypothetical protein